MKKEKKLSDFLPCEKGGHCLPVQDEIYLKQWSCKNGCGRSDTIRKLLNVEDKFNLSIPIQYSFKNYNVEKELWLILETPSPTKKFNYYISNHGRIKSENKISGVTKILKGSTVRSGYKQLNIKLKGGKRCNTYIHRFIGLNFMQNKEQSRKFMIHIDGDPASNHYKNLKWVNRIELNEWNAATRPYDASKRTGYTKGTKLTEAKVIIIKKMLKSNKNPKVRIAKKFGISSAQVLRIEREINWKHVKIS